MRTQSKVNYRSEAIAIADAADARETMRAVDRMRRLLLRPFAPSPRLEASLRREARSVESLA